MAINPKELGTDELYFADEFYMSVSSFKLFEKCELKGLQGFGEPTEAMLIGSYVDAYIEGTLEEFKKNHPEIISSRGSTKGQLKVGFKKAEEVCEFLDNDKVFKQFMSGEKQTVMTGEITGVPFKIKIDSYSKGIAINDLKVMASVTNRDGEYYDFVTKWGYDVQLACYQEIVRQNTGEQLLCYICAVTKEDPINSVIINIPQVFLDRALYRVEDNIKHFYDVKIGKVEPMGCGKCNVCISNKTETEIISLEDIIDNY